MDILIEMIKNIFTVVGIYSRSPCQCEDLVLSVWPLMATQRQPTWRKHQHAALIIRVSKKVRTMPDRIIKNRMILRMITRNCVGHRNSVVSVASPGGGRAGGGRVS